MARIRIGFSDDTHWTPWGWAIKRYMGTTFYHTYFFFDDLDETWESVTTGVRVLPRQKWLEKHKIVREFCFIIPDARMEEVRAFAKSKLGTEYGYFQYIAILFDLARTNGLNRVICSEFVARCLSIELGYPEDTNFDIITPRDVYERAKEKYGFNSGLWTKIPSMIARK